MAKKSTDNPRRRTIPVLPWWIDAVKIALRERPGGKMTQQQLAEAIDATPVEVTRALNGEMPVIDVVMAISSELGIAYPVFLPQTEAEANHLAIQARLFKRAAQLTEIVAGVGEPPSEDQPPRLESTDAIEKRKRRRQRKQAPRARQL